MSELISGKEAKLAWANGEDVGYLADGDVWFVDENTSLGVFDSFKKWQIKPKTIKINGVEVPSNVHVMHSGGCCVKISCKSSEDSESLARALRSIFK